MTKKIVAVICGVFVATGAALLAQSGSIRLVPPPAQGVRFAQPWRPNAAAGDTKIIGTVIDIRQLPVAYAKVQLRNLVTGAVQQSMDSDENGEYQFAVDDPGTYVVEMVMVDGYVLALSNAGSLARYETLRTLVQLPGRWDSLARNMVFPQNTSYFFGMSAQTTMTAATLTLAANLNIAPVDAGEPVSALATR